MRNHLHTCVCVAIIALLIAPAPGQEKLDPSKLPPKVADAVKARFPGATITQATKETENDVVVYDIEMTKDGKKHEMDCREDGTLIDIQNEIAVKDLPAAAASAIKAKYPNCTIKEAAEILVVTGKQETRDHFEVLIDTPDKKDLELSVSLDGSKIE